MRNTKSVSVCLFVLLVLGLTAVSHSRPSVIYYGWSTKDTSYIRAHAAEIDAMPYDGMAITIAVDHAKWVSGKQDTSNKLGWKILSNSILKIEQFKAQINDLQSASLVNVTDNLFPVILSSGYNADLSWFDNTKWELILRNLDVLAQIMSATGVNGIILDPEHYSGHELFSWTAQQANYATDFNTYYWRVRGIGQLFAMTLSSRLGAFDILALFGYTLERQDYNLLPAFYDGILDMLPNGSTFTDGYEFSYGYKNKSQFQQGEQHITSAVSRSGNPEAYKEFVKPGFGLWFDYDKTVDYFTPREWIKSISHAKLIAPRFVWVYSHAEMMKWTEDNYWHLQGIRLLGINKKQ